MENRTQKGVNNQTRSFINKHQNSQATHFWNHASSLVLSCVSFTTTLIKWETPLKSSGFCMQIILAEAYNIKQNGSIILMCCQLRREAHQYIIVYVTQPFFFFFGKRMTIYERLLSSIIFKIREGDFLLILLSIAFTNIWYLKFCYLLYQYSRFY